MGNQLASAAPTGAGAASGDDSRPPCPTSTHKLAKADLPPNLPLHLPPGFVPPEPIPVDLPKGFENKFAVVLKNVLTPAEVQAMLQLAEGKGFETATVNVGGGREMLDRNYRRGQRCIIDSTRLSRAIFHRVRHAIPSTWEGGWHVCGANERLRFLKYQPGDFFAMHMDGAYVRGGEKGAERVGETSFVTMQVYLNDGGADADMRGGATRFFGMWERDKAVSVVPEAGMVLLFEHRILHDGQRVTEGLKYTIRTDIMYTLKGPGHEY